MKPGETAKHLTVWHLNGATSRFEDVTVKESTSEHTTIIYTSASDGLRKTAQINRAQISILSMYEGV